MGSDARTLPARPTPARPRPTYAARPPRDPWRAAGDPRWPPRTSGVAGLMAMLIVDRLEAVEVEHHERAGEVVADRLADPRGHVLVEPAAIEQPGEAVAIGEHRELVER